MAYYCLYGEFETGPYKTCTAGHTTKTGRRKVVYDMTNAPLTFGSESRKSVKRNGKAGEVSTAETGEPQEYVGGSVAPKGDGEKIPRRLMN